VGEKEGAIITNSSVILVYPNNFDILLQVDMAPFDY
jgi:hypothetical protein